MENDSEHPLGWVDGCQAPYHPQRQPNTPRISDNDMLLSKKQFTLGLSADKKNGNCRQNGAPGGKLEVATALVRKQTHCSRPIQSVRAEIRGFHMKAFQLETEHDP